MGCCRCVKQLDSKWPDCVRIGRLSGLWRAPAASHLCATRMAQRWCRWPATGNSFAPARAHPLMFVQVQCEQEGMLLTAQEEGVTFLLSLPRNGS